MKRIVFLVFMLLSAVSLFAQQSIESVYLKNGSIIKGTIIEEIPNVSLKIQTNDGSLFVYKMSEVEKITKEKANVSQRGYASSQSPTYNGNSDIKTGFKFLLDDGYTFGSDDNGREELMASFGWQIIPYLYVGGGVGGNYYIKADMFTLPIFGNVRGYIPAGNASVHPFVDVKTGYSLDLTNTDYGGLYFSATTGIEIHHFMVGIGYASQGFSYNGDSYYSSTYTTGGFTTRIGLVF